MALAFLEHGSPDLAEAAAAMANEGVDSIRIAPMFFGRGGHLRDDFPRHLEAARARVPQVTFEVTEAAGESEQVLEALATFALGAGSDPDWKLK